MDSIISIKSLQTYDDIQFKGSEQKVYFIRAGDFVKIGIAENVVDRLRGIQTSNPYPLQLMAVVLEGGKALEHMLHLRFSHLNTVGEWFKYEGELKDLLGGQEEGVALLEFDKRRLLGDLAEIDTKTAEVIRLAEANYIPYRLTKWMSVILSEYIRVYPRKKTYQHDGGETTYFSTDELLSVFNRHKNEAKAALRTSKFRAHVITPIKSMKTVN